MTCYKEGHAPAEVMGTTDEDIAAERRKRDALAAAVLRAARAPGQGSGGHGHGVAPDPGGLVAVVAASRKGAKKRDRRTIEEIQDDILAKRARRGDE